MIITNGNEDEKGNQEKESKEESILAMLGIIGTILNLVVIIFVYIYTTLWTAEASQWRQLTSSDGKCCCLLTKSLMRIDSVVQ